MKRRRCVTTLAGWGALGLALGARPGVALAHARPGPVSPPVPAPDLPFVDHLGRPHGLRRWMTGQITAVQTIFTGCSSICPLQGALFAASQLRLIGQASPVPIRWLSMSIDPLGDTPESLRAWLQRMGPADAAWSAGLPRMADVDRLRRELDGIEGPSAPALDDHSNKVYFFDTQAQLRWRTAALPTADEVVRVLKGLATLLRG